MTRAYEAGEDPESSFEAFIRRMEESAPHYDYRSLQDAVARGEAELIEERLVGPSQVPSLTVSIGWQLYTAEAWEGQPEAQAWPEDACNRFWAWYATAREMSEAGR